MVSQKEQKEILEHLQKIREIFDRLERSVKKRNKRKVRQDVKELIARAAIIGKKSGFSGILEEASQMLLEWWLEWKYGKIKKRKLSVKQVYALWAKTYEKEENLLVEMQKGRLLPLLGNVKDKTILDLGCGTGKNAVLLAKKGATVYGIDFSKEMLAEARKKAKRARAKINFVKRDVTKKLPYEARKFDAVISALVFNHVGNIVPVLKEIKRVLREEGICLISDLHPSSIEPKLVDKYPFLPHKGIFTALYRRTFPEYINAINKSGLKLKEVFEYTYAIKEIKRAKRGHKRLEPKRPLLLILKLRKRS